MFAELLTAVLVATALATCIGMLLTLSAAALPAGANPLVELIDARLPQTQCGQCGFPGCRPYAAAIAQGDAGIDRCPPGGDATVRELARLLDRDSRRVAPGLPASAGPLLAVIDELRCTGCNLCVPACPVDAIIGAPRFTHTVLADACTGCGLCVPPCPVDCIRLETLPAR